MPPIDKSVPAVVRLVTSLLALGGCQTPTERQVAKTAENNKQAAAEINRICALPDAEREAELRKIKEQSGLMLSQARAGVLDLNKKSLSETWHTVVVIDRGCLQFDIRGTVKFKLHRRFSRSRALAKTSSAGIASTAPVSNSWLRLCASLSHARSTRTTSRTRGHVVSKTMPGNGLLLSRRNNCASP